MRLLYCGNGWLPIIEWIRARLPSGATIAQWDRAQPLASVVGDIDVILPSNAPITREVIAAAHALRLIQQPAAGTEGVDRAAAAERAIPICNAPAANHVAVAELAMYLLLGVHRACRPRSRRG